MMRFSCLRTVWNNGYRSTKNHVDHSFTRSVCLPDCLQFNKRFGDNVDELPSYNLFPHSPDLLIKEIIATSENVNGLSVLRNIIHDNGPSINVYHACQAVVITKYMISLNNQQTRLLKLIEDNIELKEMYIRLFDLIQSNNNEVDDEILARTLHSARVFNFEEATNVFNNLLTECFLRIPTKNLASLSYLCTCVKLDNLSNLNRQIELLHNLLELLPQCQTPYDLKCISICISNLRNVVSDAVISQFYQKIIAVNESQNIPSDIIVTCFQTALLPHRSINEQKKIVNLLVEKIIASINEFSIAQLTTIKTNMKYIKEDVRQLESSISLRALQLLNQVSHPLDKFELLYCVDSKSLPKLESSASILKSAYSYLHLPFSGLKLFSILNILKFQEPEFLNRVLLDSVSCANKKNAKFVLVLIKAYTSYLLDSNRIYRHEKFENELHSTLMELLDENWGFKTREVAAVGAFFILTCRQGVIPSEVIERVLAHSHQFQSGEIVTLSKCLKQVIPRSNNCTEHLLQLNAICNCLNDQLENHLEAAPSLLSVAQVIAGVLLRNKSVPITQLNTGMDKYYSRLKEFTSVSLIETCRNIIAAKYYAPDIVDAMVDYVLKNENVTSWAIAMLLNASYYVGYYPQAGVKFFDKCSDVLLSDCKNLKGQLLLRATLALALYDHLPPSLVSYIFSEEFVNFLEHDIDRNLNSDYATQTRYLLMLVNRIVCLEYPEYNVPWFHERYCQEHATERNTVFIKEVENVLSQLVGGHSYYKKFSYTPYFYQLPFEFLIDSQGRPVPFVPYNAKLWNKTDVPDCVRVGLNILSEKIFCSNFQHTLGQYHTTRRHLEMMEYKIIEIPYYEWKDCSNQARINILYKKIRNL